MNKHRFVARALLLQSERDSADASREGLELYGKYVEEAKQVSLGQNVMHMYCN
jgi:hypothetical protein